MKHAVIIPLIGGEAIGVEKATGKPPEYMLSYTPFAANDSHLVNYYKQRGLDIPYHNLDEGQPKFDTKVDSVSSVCPCAGLSALSTTSSSDNEKNEWMYKTAEYVFENIQPRVYWGENAPGLMSNIGLGVRKRLIEIASSNGYTASFYRTKSLLHGVPQVRNRSFFFFWKGDKAPVFDYFDRPFPSIEELIANEKSNFQTEPINSKIPSEDPFYRYVLEEIGGGVSHKEFVASYERFGIPVRGNDVVSIIESTPGHPHSKVETWLRERGHEKQANYIRRIQDKEAIGKGVMRRNTIIPKGHIGAFIGHYPTMLTHPVEDRYISYREAMTIMGLPPDFELLRPRSSINHICQNVPVQTAADMAAEVENALEKPDSREWVSGTVMQYNTTRSFTVENSTSSSLSTFF